jgi:epoxyqueuosine reductase
MRRPAAIIEPVAADPQHNAETNPEGLDVRALARASGFELAGVARAEPVAEAAYHLDWAARGLAGKMSYLTGYRAQIRQDPRELLPGARSIVCVGKLYNGPQPYSTHFDDAARGWISRYAWGDDYHEIVRRGLERLERALREASPKPFESRICVDTSPLLERSYARLAGLGWIGRNKCLINEQQGSWFFLGELLTTLDLPPDSPPPGRCGTCTRCIDACPTQAIVPNPAAPGGWELDSRLCISYFTIELRGEIPQQHRPGIGKHLFGCDICQDVCPWNNHPARATPVTDEFGPRAIDPPLEEMAALTPEQFRALFATTPVSRARYRGVLRNVAVAMGNAVLNRGQRKLIPALERLASHEDEVVARHARWALGRIKAATES